MSEQTKDGSDAMSLPGDMPTLPTNEAITAVAGILGMTDHEPALVQWERICALVRHFAGAALARSALEERELRVRVLEEALREVLNTRPTWSVAYGYAEERARSVLNKENGNASGQEVDRGR